MRSSDWSSDVCSYDICDGIGQQVEHHLRQRPRVCMEADVAVAAGQGELALVGPLPQQGGTAAEDIAQRDLALVQLIAPRLDLREVENVVDDRQQMAAALMDIAGIVPVALGRRARSEEHTSELQSLMRISYAVFCLKKKKSEKR